MTEFYLIESLQTFLEKTLNDINQDRPGTDREPYLGSLRTVRPLKAEMQDKEQAVKVNIYNGFVPSAKQESSVFPYVSIFLLDGSVDREYCTCRAQFDIGVYSQEDNRALMNMLRRIINGLSQLENYMLDNKFELSLPFTWSTFEENKHPFHNASIITSWSWYAPCPQNFSTI
ncbi:Uncharacterised protein [Anaerobiospirillum thomasii]|uniref:hypothetical protein n=1 Tax=Anaerobiospirillum thomasii TaxID=179995 RepID=UPI000D9777DF|nr:hypothetical protein [Anaerobiospirillum thomasii]SPT67645.1 Uncharacterised protein [Anaerobiospirillum thomasii]SPT68723.1 Uncharacterised protein [Anaerobiospirillum thomasii]SPT72421.1 Uncharacterised protein [Anaerobiospirillum thomasii]